MQWKKEIKLEPTSLKALRAVDACTPRYVHLREALGANYGDTTPITMLQILDLNDMDDCLWALQFAQPDKRFLQLVLCDFAEHVLWVWEKYDATDKRPHDCIAATRRFLNGEGTEEEMAAWAAEAAGAAWAAWAAEAAWAAWAAEAAEAAGATRAAGAAEAAWAAEAAAEAAEVTWQEVHLREMLAVTQ